MNATPQGIPVVSLASDPKRPNYVYAGTTQTFYLSRDGGRTWYAAAAICRSASTRRSDQSGEHGRDLLGSAHEIGGGFIIRATPSNGRGSIRWTWSSRAVAFGRWRSTRPIRTGSTPLRTLRHLSHRPPSGHSDRQSGAKTATARPQSVTRHHWMQKRGVPNGTPPFVFAFRNL